LEFPLVYSMAVSLSSSGSCRYATYSDFLTDGTRLSLGPNRLVYRVILVVPTPSQTEAGVRPGIGTIPYYVERRLLSPRW